MRIVRSPVGTVGTHALSAAAVNPTDDSGVAPRSGAAGPEGVTVDTTNRSISDLGMRGAVRAVARAGLIGTSALLLVAAPGEASPTMGPDSRLIYVSSSVGQDTNDGMSPGTPKKTLAGAVAAIRDGYPDWVFLLRGDTWNEGFAPFEFSGRSVDEPIVITAYGPGDSSPMIRPADPSMGPPDELYVLSYGVDYLVSPDDNNNGDGGGGSNPPLLLPGSGWAGETPQPPPTGDPSQPGHDARAIARWDVVPFQTVSDELEIGVVAYHINGIDRVDFSVNGGPWLSVTEPSENPRTGVNEYWVKIRAELFETDAAIEVRAIAWPNNGIPRVLSGNETTCTGPNHSLVLFTNYAGTLSETIRYVAPEGDDTQDGTTPQTAMASADAAAWSMYQEIGTLDGARIILMPGTHDIRGASWPRSQIRNEKRWLTIEGLPGADVGSVLVRGTSEDSRFGSVKLLQWKNLTIIASNGAPVLRSWVSESKVWFDNVVVDGIDRSLDTAKFAFGTTDFPGGKYATDVTASNLADGLTAFTLQRESSLSRLLSDAFSNSICVLNSSVTDINPLDSSAHPDILQFFSADPLENLLFLNLTSDRDFD